MTWREQLPEYVKGLLKYAEYSQNEGWTILVRSMASMLDIPPKENLLWRDIVNDLAQNDNCTGILKDGWWLREWEQIDYITIHHTLSHNPYATAEWYVNKEGGRPSIPYTIWVTETGEVLLCNQLIEGCWHDHTGHANTHLSIGLAGELHINAPSNSQLDALARICKWAIANSNLPLIDNIDKIRGHAHWYNTVCPGWAAEKSGLWEAQFYSKLEELLEGD